MKKNIIIATIFLTIIVDSQAQGCSDAGICSITAIQNQDSTSIKKNSLEVGYIFGKGFEGVTYNNGFITYSKSIKEKWGLSSKVTYNQASGDFGTRGQFGDLFIISNYSFKTKNSNIIKPFLGFKIPFTSGNLKINNKSLPMDYQASLGTFDLLLGFDYKYKKWNFDVAYQLPILQTNKNSYFDEFSKSDEFPSTNLFIRKSDILVRTHYNIVKNDSKWAFKPNLMGIYHTGNDTFENIFGQRQVIENSKGLTINASFITEFNISENNGFQINLAAPLLAREIRPDGLTRSFLVSISHQYKF